jgi:hypothetical protein
MSVRIVELVNAMRPKSYLELGTFDGKNFRSVACDDKVSVDINGKGTFTGTTDEFFAQNTRRFDVTFIDACHKAEQVRLDFNNAIKVTNRAIILHDCIPPTEYHCHPKECSDSYVLLNTFIDLGMEFRALDHDCGLTVVRKEHFKHVESCAPTAYDDFMRKVSTVSLKELVGYA